MEEKTARWNGDISQTSYADEAFQDEYGEEDLDDIDDRRLWCR